MKRYSVLWVAFNNNEFTYEEALKILKDKENVLNVVLSQLKKSGWISAEKSKDDKRKGLYQLRFPEEIINEIAKES